MGVVRRRGNVYVIDCYDAAGNKRWEATGPHKKEAEAVVAQGMRDRRNGKYTVATRPSRFEEFPAWTRSR